MKFPSRETVEKLKQQYPIGTRIVLRKMEDFQAPPIGTKGTVQGVDDIGSLLVKWDNGCGLNVAYGVDEVEKLDTVTTVCYGQEQVWDSRKEAKEHFLEGIYATEGSERERYALIYTKLILGYDYCTDELD